MLKSNLVLWLAGLALAGCAELDMTGKDSCQNEFDCLDQQSCSLDGYCVDECASHAGVTCQENKVYWVDECGNLEDEREDCPYGCKADLTGCADCVPDCGSEHCCGDDGCGGQCDFDCGTNDFCNPDSCTCEACPAGSVSCFGVCANLNTDEDHCGACGDPCGANAECLSGDCQCVTDYTLCLDLCVDTDNDPDNCGSCGHECDPGQECQGGSCEERECCGSMSLYGDIHGHVFQMLTGDPLQISLAVVSAMEALTSPTPTHQDEVTSDAQGEYQTNCIDLSMQSLALFMLTDDPEFDGSLGDWYPTYTAVLAINSNEDKTCVLNAPDVFGVPTGLVATLSQAPGLENISSGGFLAAFVLDNQGNPVEGAVLMEDGQPPQEIPGAVYPSADLTDFSGIATSSNGMVVLMGPVSMIQLLPVKTGMTWNYGTAGVATGFCFVRMFYAN